MAKKRKQGRADAESVKPAAPQPVFTSPFKDLKKMLAERERAQQLAKPDRVVVESVSARTKNLPGAKIAPPSATAPIATATQTEEVPPLDDAAILREALAGVRPLDGAGRARMPVEPRVTHAIVNEDDEVIAQLSDLVSGQAPFDITETDEYVEGYRVGLDPRLLSQLRRGEFAMQAHFDLHGMIQPDAKEALKSFIIGSVRKGLRSVLVVHGRGLRSPGGRAVLKHAASGWLSHGAIGGHVLAFTSARSSDGGAGAMYVLLRRERRREPFNILQGSKRKD